ncbi:hypothetical protein ATCC90586_001313 [Pythium insidiosum]|nr:hypothetical protein ATCC90586_001313 [Pythium insidiosum]
MSDESAARADDWETSDVVPRILAREQPPPMPPQPQPQLDGQADDDHDAVAQATTAFRSQLRLEPPPPSQDGGAFQSPHAQYDPNGAYGQSVSPATATAASARFGPLDPVLLAGLENPRERLTLLKFEDQIVRFVRNPREVQLSFPPLSSYHRLIVHRLAERCALEHQTADYSPYAQGYDGNASRVVTLFKTAHTLVPRVLLIDLSTEKKQPAMTPASAPKIMIRKRGAPPRGGASGGPNGRNSAEAKNTQRSIEDRERAYAEARARIFGEETPSSSGGETSSSATAPASSPTADNSVGKAPAGSHQAAGPDGSRGFTRGSRSANGSDVTHDSATRNCPTSSSTSSSPSSSSPSSQSAAVDGTKADHLTGFKPQQNWKESKVLWRNREQEMNDPDFTRNHDAYRPSRDSSNNAYQNSIPRYALSLRIQDGHEVCLPPSISG